MNERRFVLTARVWDRLEPGKASDAGAMLKKTIPDDA